MDCFQGLKLLPDNSVDSIITDPPYGSKRLCWDKKNLNWEVLAEEFYRVLKTNGTLYVFGQMPMISDVYQELSKHFKFRQDLVWYKSSAISLYKTMFAKYHENILFFVKDNKEMLTPFGKYVKKRREELGLSLREVGELCKEKWYHKGGNQYFETGKKRPTKKQYETLKSVLKLNNNFDILGDKPIFNFEDIQLEGKPYKTKRKGYVTINEGKRNPKTVLEYPVIQNGKEYHGHPTQKPKALIKYLITSCSNRGNIILDPFMGSGTTAIACKELDRIFIGFEISKEYIEICNKRLSTLM